ncbi:unnamed protein product [Euphydryas editha]|uniref:Uncharacterized protein n=1 Tax=Euphydryas editha TaxID=104508 RepID=A0AAU9UC34_EUPED|nr:unnamed protein product [Euphydryas editha]
MCSLLWILSIFAIFVADVWTGALQHKDISLRRCHHCAHKARCELLSSPVMCPAGQPLCATVASAPNFTSTLTCAAASEAPCSLIYNSNLALEMTCTCDGHLCNAPFAAQFQNELLNFSSKIPTNTSAELTQMFLKSSFFANVTKTKLYEAITIIREATEKQTKSVSAQSTTIGLTSIGNIADIAPRAEALKHEATVPPDDDEDESEGSGNIDENKAHADAPAAPSSYLPAEENNVNPIIINEYLIVLTILCSLEVL